MAVVYQFNQLIENEGFNLLQNDSTAARILVVTKPILQRSYMIKDKTMYSYNVEQCLWRRTDLNSLQSSCYEMVCNLLIKSLAALSVPDRNAVSDRLQTKIQNKKAAGSLGKDVQIALEQSGHTQCSLKEHYLNGYITSENLFI